MTIEDKTALAELAAVVRYCLAKGYQTDAVIYSRIMARHYFREVMNLGELFDYFCPSFPEIS